MPAQRSRKHALTAAKAQRHLVRSGSTNQADQVPRGQPDSCTSNDPTLNQAHGQGGLDWECVACRMRFTDTEEYGLHLGDHADTVVSCGLSDCSREFKLRNLYYHHKKSHQADFHHERRQALPETSAITADESRILHEAGDGAEELSCRMDRAQGLQGSQ